MALPKTIEVKEGIKDLKKLLKTCPRLIVPRLRMLIEMKKYEDLGGISKRNLADLIGVNHNSIQTWRTLYLDESIAKLSAYIKNDGRPTILSKEEHRAIEEKLNDRQNPLRGYVELLHWVKSSFNKEIKYNTLLNYTNREFAARVKVARKSHIKKDEQAVEAFKKTLAPSAGKFVKKQDTTRR